MGNLARSRVQRKRTSNKSNNASNAKVTPSRAAAARAPQGRASEHLRTFKIMGDLPSFNDWSCQVVDHENETIYTYGGCPPDNGKPASDFYACDMRTMVWTNLSNEMSRQAHPGDPFAPTTPAPLPRLHRAVASLLRLNDKSFMLLFGGRRNGAKGASSSEIIAIDLRHLTWWIMPVLDGPVTSRMASSMAIMHNRIFIFGGVDDAGATLRSFSVAEYTDHAWRWTIRDAPYPEHVPQMGYGGAVQAVYEGRKLLLLPGWGPQDKPIDPSASTSVLFHTIHHTFQTQLDTTGDFPKDVRWYNLQPSPIAAPAPRRRGRPKLSSPAASSTDIASEPSNRARICAWLPYNAEHLVPEIYEYLLPPDEEIRCLGLRDKLWALDLDLQSYMVVGSRSFLLGYNDKDYAEPVWNVCVEIMPSDRRA